MSDVLGDFYRNFYRTPAHGIARERTPSHGLVRELPTQRHCITRECTLLHGVGSAHNPKVGGSNPPPATKKPQFRAFLWSGVCLLGASFQRILQWAVRRVPLRGVSVGSGRAGLPVAGGDFGGTPASTARWYLDVVPSGDYGVMLSVQAGQACGEIATVCTADGRVLCQSIQELARIPHSATAAPQRDDRRHSWPSGRGWRRVRRPRGRCRSR